MRFAGSRNMPSISTATPIALGAWVVQRRPPDRACRHEAATMPATPPLSSRKRRMSMRLLPMSSVLGMSIRWGGTDGRGKGKTDLTARHDAYFLSTEAQDDCSPLRILKRGEKVELPPALVVQGTADSGSQKRWQSSLRRSIARRAVRQVGSGRKHATRNLGVDRDGVQAGCRAHTAHSSPQRGSRRGRALSEAAAEHWFEAVNVNEEWLICRTIICAVSNRSW